LMGFLSGRFAQGCGEALAWGAYYKFHALAYAGKAGGAGDSG